MRQGKEFSSLCLCASVVDFFCVFVVQAGYRVFSKANVAQPEVEI